MKSAFFAALIAAIVIAPYAASAHDASLHKGKLTIGEVLSTGSDHIQIQTKSGKVKVSFTKDTNFEHEDEIVDKTHIQTGEHVAILGTTLESGEIVAREVLINPDLSDDKEHGARSHENPGGETKTQKHASH